MRKISGIVLNLMEDPRVEVRSMAGKVMSGLLHCEILPNQHELRVSIFSFILTWFDQTRASKTLSFAGNFYEEE